MQNFLVCIFFFAANDQYTLYFSSLRKQINKRLRFRYIDTKLAHLTQHIRVRTHILIGTRGEMFDYFLTGKLQILLIFQG